MMNLPETVALPLKIDDEGAIRVSDTRVTLDVLIACYLQGDTPEEIAEGFPTVPLTDIYTVIAYYLAHQAELDAYLSRRDAEADRRRHEVEAQDSTAQRAQRNRLRALVEQRRKDDEA